jgi:hypothetical protein
MSRFCIVDFDVEPTKQVTITINKSDLDNGKLYDLCFNPCKYEEEFEKIIGNERVIIKNGCNGKDKILLTNAGNIFYGGRLEAKPRNYRLVYGNDGLPCKVPHFLCINSPCKCNYQPGNINLDEV